MADITVTAAQVAVVNENEAEMSTGIVASGVTITKGQAVAINSTGYLVLADGSTGAPNGFRGIALTGGTAGEPLTYLEEGSCYGFTLTGADYGDTIFLSNTAGALDDATGGDVAVACGRVKPLHDGATPSKVLFVNARRLA